MLALSRADAARAFRPSAGDLPGHIVPGLSHLIVSAISNRRYALVQGCLLPIGLTYVLVNLLTEVVYRWVNPRMRG